MGEGKQKGCPEVLGLMQLFPTEAGRRVITVTTHHTMQVSILSLTTHLNLSCYFSHFTDKDTQT